MISTTYACQTAESPAGGGERRRFERAPSIRSTTVGSGGYITFPVGPLCFGALCYLIFNPGGDGGTTVSHPVGAVRDVDGDGHPDHLFSQSPGELRVARSRVGRTDLLARVHRPMGAVIDIDYERAGNTREMPQSRWVLSRVKVYDGYGQSDPVEGLNNHTLRRISYAAGRYDRFEREFLGFARVTVDDVNTAGWAGADDGSSLPVYRRSELDFHNDLHARRGLVRETRLLPEFSMRAY